jgi:alkanesulfonate monooxygenase SsuD/methylene tetrahydromethanopterin reductase-like flavin-dependent oxidoreductase (luciferase family)
MYPERVIFGDVDQCIQRLKDIEALGITRLCLLTNFGGMPHQEIMRSLERFATHVLPHFPSA